MCRSCGGDDDGDADRVETLEQPHHLQRELRVEISRGLVRDDDRRLGNNRARDADPLLLAGRHLDREALFAPEQPDLVERGADPPVNLAAGNPGDDQRQRHVVPDRPVVQQLVVLENHADVAPVRRYAAPAQRGDAAAADQNLPARRSLDQRDQLECGALAGAGVAGQEYHLARRHLER